MHRPQPPGLQSIPRTSFFFLWIRSKGQCELNELQPDWLKATASNRLLGGSAMKGLASGCSLVDWPGHLTPPLPPIPFKLKVLTELNAFLSFFHFMFFFTIFSVNPPGQVDEVEQSKHAAVLRCLPFPRTLFPSDSWTVAQTLPVGACFRCHFNPWAFSVQCIFFFFFFYFSFITLRTNCFYLYRGGLASQGLIIAPFGDKSSTPSSSCLKPLNLPCRSVWPVWQPRYGPRTHGSDQE